MGRCKFTGFGKVYYTNGVIIEDSCWLRPIKNTQHMNVAELDTVLRGVDIVPKSLAMVLHVKTDFLCMYHWLTDVLIGNSRLKRKCS